MKVNVWKYPLFYTLLTLALVVTFLILDHFRILRLGFEFPEWIKPLVLLPVLVAVISTSLSTLIPKRITIKLKWAYAQPGVSQLYYFIGFQAFIIIGLGIANSATNNTPYALEVAEIITDTLAIISMAIFTYLLLRILRND